MTNNEIVRSMRQALEFLRGISGELSQRIDPENMYEKWDLTVAFSNIDSAEIHLKRAIEKMNNVIDA